MSSDNPLGIVAGSGIDLAQFLDDVSGEEVFENIPALPKAGVLGHEGRFIRGRCEGQAIVLQCGRLHFYEGCDYSTVVRPVDVMKAYGVRTVLFTNAAASRSLLDRNHPTRKNHTLCRKVSQEAIMSAISREAAFLFSGYLSYNNQRWFVVLARPITQFLCSMYTWPGHLVVSHKLRERSIKGGTSIRAYAGFEHTMMRRSMRRLNPI